MTVRLNDPVIHDGRVTSIAKLAELGLIEFVQVDNFSGKGITKYFADIKGTKSGWEIGKLAYLSRIGEGTL